MDLTTLFSGNLETKNLTTRVVSLAGFQRCYMLQNSCMFLFHTAPFITPEKEMFVTFIFMTNKQGYNMLDTCHVTSLKLDGNCSGSWRRNDVPGKCALISGGKKGQNMVNSLPPSDSAILSTIRSPSGQQCKPLWDRLNHQQKANNLSGFCPAISHLAMQNQQPTGFGGYIICMLGELLGL